MSSVTNTPTTTTNHNSRTLVETTHGIKEAAKNLQKLTFHWDSPKQIVIVTKPDDSLMDKVQDLLNYLATYNLIIYLEDQMYPLLKLTSNPKPFKTGQAEMRAWNAYQIRSNMSCALSASISITPNADGQPGSLSFYSLPRMQSSSAAAAADKSERPSKSVSFQGLDQQACATEAQSRIDSIETFVFNPEDIDLVITLGGDGTVLFASWLFQTIVPPLLPLHLGTLGFLTVFDFNRYQEVLDKVLRRIKDAGVPNGAAHTIPTQQTNHATNGSVGRRTGSFIARKVTMHGEKSAPTISSSTLPLSEQGVRISLRMRFTCAIYRSKTILKSAAPYCFNPTYFAEKKSADNLNTTENKEINDKNIIMAPEPDDVFQVLNDVVVDRGPSPYMASLEVFGDGKHLTTVQADGLLVSTPTGSTAYSLSAGGSLVHPEVPAILLTPVCPHTLSFRPMLLPDSMELKIVVPTDARAMAFVSFDGRHRVPLQQGDALVVTSSIYPVPTLCLYDQTKDWFDSLGRCLRWNERAIRQKSFVWGKGIVERNEEDSADTHYPWDS